MDIRREPFAPDDYHDAVFLARCSEEAACAWLADRRAPNRLDAADYIFEPVSKGTHVLEYLLYRRDSELIDAALANHGRSGGVVARVYQRSGPATRTVACRNAALFLGPSIHCLSRFSARPLFNEIVETGSLGELRAVCENPGLDNECLTRLLTAWEKHPDRRDQSEPPKVPDERFHRIVRFLARNPRLQAPASDLKEDWDDGHGWFEYVRVLRTAWSLSLHVPIDRDWAISLTLLYRNLASPDVEIDGIEEALAHWRSPGDFPAPLSEALRELIAAKCMAPTIDMLESEDPALRHAFYLTFDPESPACRHLKDKDWDAWEKRDAECNDYLLRNPNFERYPLPSDAWEPPTDDADFETNVRERLRRLEGEAIFQRSQSRDVYRLAFICCALLIGLVTAIVFSDLAAFL